MDKSKNKDQLSVTPLSYKVNIDKHNITTTKEPEVKTVTPEGGRRSNYKGKKEFEQFIEEMVLSDYSHHTIANYTKVVPVFLKIADKPIVELNEENVIEFKREMQRREWSTSTKVRALGYIKNFLNCQGKHELSRKITVPREGEIIRTFLTEAELESMKNNAKKNPLHLPLLSTMKDSCARISETINFRKNDINWDDRTIIIRQGKGKKDRIQPLTDETMGDLRDYIDYHRKTHKNNEDYLFISHHGRKFGPTGINDILKKLACEAKIEKKVSAHTIRRSSAKIVYNKTRDLYLVKNLLGHKMVETTLKYLCIDEKDMEKTREALSSIRNESTADLSNGNETQSLQANAGNIPSSTSEKPSVQSYKLRLIEMLSKSEISEDTFKIAMNSLSQNDEIEHTKIQKWPAGNDIGYS